MSAFSRIHKDVSVEDHGKWLSSAIQDDKNKYFMIVYGSSSIGFCSLRNIDCISKTAELQIKLGVSSYRGIGLGTKSVERLLSKAWREFQLNKVYLYVFSDNLRAKAVYSKLGFSLEGKLKKHLYVDHQYKDLEIMSIFKEIH